MNIKRLRISLRNLDKENFDVLIKALYEMSEPNSEGYSERIEALRNSLYFNFGYLEFHVVKAVALDVNKNEVKVIYDVIS
jgi:hypothetical protein